MKTAFPTKIWQIFPTGILYPTRDKYIIKLCDSYLPVKYGEIEKTDYFKIRQLLVDNYLVGYIFKVDNVVDSSDLYILAGISSTYKAVRWKEIYNDGLIKINRLKDGREMLRLYL